MNWTTAPAGFMPGNISAWTAADDAVERRLFAVVGHPDGWVPQVADVARNGPWAIVATMMLSESPASTRAEAQAVCEQWAASRWAEQSAFDDDEVSTCQQMLADAADALGMPGSPSWPEALERMRELAGAATFEVFADATELDMDNMPGWTSKP